MKEGATAVFLLLDCLQNCYYRQSLSDFELGPTEQGAETMWAQLQSWCSKVGGSDCMLAYMQSSPPPPTHSQQYLQSFHGVSHQLCPTKITLNFIIKQDTALHKAFCLSPTLAITKLFPETSVRVRLRKPLLRLGKLRGLWDAYRLLKQ